ncbi:DNA methyltransferase [uncultured Senegalimassilia sp.]|uniref:DNA methyltransferase n=1 Tax=uncultured Senegalimassilia sp. TaxID=1714350 RepID=UPI0027DB148E|nr:DNA methyltransferase [uncultured Senegalimassilia sp.]
MQDKLARMDDVATYFDVTPETIRNWIRTRDLPATKFGRQWRFDWDAIKAWQDNPCVTSHKKSTYKDYVSAASALDGNRDFRAEINRGGIRLINGDCLVSMEGIADGSVDLLLTDPPYNLGLFMQERATNLKRMRENYFGAAGWDNLCADDWAESMDEFFGEAARVVRKGGALIVFMAVIKLETLIGLAQKHGFYYKTTGAWHKLNPMPRNMNLHFINSTESWVYFVNGAKTGTFNNDGKALHDFFETSVTPKSEKEYGKHPTQKPVELMDYFVRTLTNPGNIVLDPFMGSGSSGVSAKGMGRKFIGIELDEDYFDIAVQRMGVNK